jgi:prepilin-type N-terminal cleavage/methylation domain-containing protein
MKTMPSQPLAAESGFTLTEFLISSLILLVLSAALYRMVADVQRSAAVQAESQSVVNDAQIAFQAIERCIRQAGNNPLGLQDMGIRIISPTEMQIKSDLTGSLGPGNPDKGDPDGDVDDSNENVRIRFNRATHSIEIVPEGGSAQIIAGNISDLLLQYYDANGGETNLESNVREIKITIKATNFSVNPQAHQKFGMEIISRVRTPI